MATETFNLSGDMLKFFGYYLTVKKPVFNKIISSYMGSKTNLTDVPLKILAYLLYLDHKINQEDPSLREEERWRIIDSKDYRDHIADKLGFQYRNRINNYFSKMRKMGIILDNGINNYFKVDPGDVSVTYKINLK